MTDQILKMLSPADKVQLSAAVEHLGFPESQTEDVARAILRKAGVELERASSRQAGLRVVRGRNIKPIRKQ